jgi:hypothetical protein
LNLGATVKVLFVSSEIYPLAKTGALADVSAALPKALATLGVDIRLVQLRRTHGIWRSQGCGSLDSEAN